jgi:hypothetical protein
MALPPRIQFVELFPAILARIRICYHHHLFKNRNQISVVFSPFEPATGGDGIDSADAAT